METKLFEVRDRMTFVPAIAIKLVPSCEEERYMLACMGYGLEAEDQGDYILAGKVETGELTYDWRGHDGYPGVRTLPEAHKYIHDHWDELKTGDVIDVEFVLGEKPEPKIAQRLNKC